MKHSVFLVALAIIITTILSAPAHSEERDVRSPTSKDRDVWLQAALRGSRKRLSAREAVTLALQRRGWWSDRVDDVKEGWQRFKNGTKAAWKAFKENVGRDVAPYETFTDERRADELATVDKRISFQNALAHQGSRKRLSAREAVTLALQRRGWWSDRWNDVKEGAKKVGNKIKAGVEKVKEGWKDFKDGTKEAWKTFKEHTGREVAPYETYTDERRADELTTAEKRVSSRNAPALSYKRTSAQKKVVAHDWYGNSKKGWKGILSPPIYSR